jgi:aspartate/methionine/tyrosine aminotransferase
MVTSGATEAIAGALMALVSPGDEVVLFEPMYDAYVPLVRRAGGIPKFVTLKPPHFGLSEEALAAAFSPRTKAVLFNNPLNPTATIFSPADLDLLADFSVRHDAVAICDEVWEHVVFDGHRHVPVLGRPDMRERTVKISSAGKIFSLTGWKVGLVMAAPPLMKVLAKAHQYITFTTPPNLQVAVAYGLGKEDDYFEAMRADFQRSRNRFAQGLKDLGFSVLPSAGTYFLNVDIAPLGETDDITFCRRLVIEHGVAAIPVSAFYDEGAVRTVVRFCFAKRDATLDEALGRLEKRQRAASRA